MKVKVFHNVARDATGLPLGMLNGYAPGHRLALVAEVEVEDQEPGLDDDEQYDADMILVEEMFYLFNVGDDPEFGTPNQRALEYRSRGNRSLSVGDVVEVDARTYRMLRMGWDRVEDELNVATGYRAFGTYSLR